MTLGIPAAWLQLRRERMRTLVATAGVAVAVVLIFMQLGFRDALFGSVRRFHRAFRYDLAMIHARTDYLVRPESFSRRRLYQVLGVEGVEAVSPVYLGVGVWRDPAARASTRAIFVMGFDPEDRVFDLPGVVANQRRLRLPDVVLFDERSRPEYGAIPDLFRRGGRVATELGNRSVAVAGLFRLGTSFGVDGSLVTSDLNFRRIFPARQPGRIDVGLIQLEPGSDTERVRAEMVAAVANDVDILTREAFIAREIDHWNRATPIGYVFGFGVVVGLLVGTIIVYQILFSDVGDHLQEYATLKAIGYRDRFLVGVVLQQALILALLGFACGGALATLLYRIAADATNLPMQMDLERTASVFALTLVMCCVSGTAALHKLRAADPAEVF